MENSSNFYAVIMAGGTGTRLWPMSRQGKPKQFQKFISSLTMIQETYERVTKVVPRENVFVSTAQQYQSLVQEQLPEVSSEQLILEPSPRGTAPAIALVARHIHEKDPRAVVATIASDHAIRNVEEFVSSVSCALETANNHPDKLITVGINPTYPDTSLGYIKMGKEFSNNGGRRIFYVDSFAEKPDRKTAEKYIAGWEYLWNAGYFIFSVAQLLGWVKEFTPHIGTTIEAIEKMNRDGVDNRTIRELYEGLPSESIEPSIVEKMNGERRLVVPSQLEWSDVGTWGTLFDFFRGSFNSSMIVKGNHIDVESKNCLVYSKDKLVATMGLKNIIIVESDDAILVADRNNVGDVKKIIEKLREEGKMLYL